KF
ncbi:hypothetical protein D050_0647B, partial [Vibrio parahaemolyticus VPCR-2009]